MQTIAVRLTRILGRRRGRWLASLVSLATLAALVWSLGVGPGVSTAEGAPAPDPEDVLGEVVVEAGKAGPARLVLPKLAVEAPLTETELEARAREVLTRDLELSGEFEVMPASHAPTRPLDAQAPVDVAPWKDVGAKIVVRVHAERLPRGRVELRAEVHLTADAEGPAFSHALDAPLSGQRLAAHRLTDAVIGALTGYEGPFASRLTFVRTSGGRRTVYVIDPDGHNLLPVSPFEHLATAPVFDPTGALYWAASVEGGRYRVYRQGSPAPLSLEPRGSVYGLAFDEGRDRVAVSIATARGVQIFVGPADFSALEPVTQALLAMHPAFSATGVLAFAGTTRRLQRVYAGGKAVSPRGLSASAPTFCRHPDGTKIVYSVGVRERADLIAADGKGRDPVRITQSQGRNGSPACSPDGRLVAFFSTRRTGEGPGLYVMRVDGRRPRKISSMVGDSLRWSGRLRPAPTVERGSGEPVGAL